MTDSSTKQTSQDASTCKLSAIRAGYLHDDFLHLFNRSVIKKMPIINRGTYARCECITSQINKFLASSTPQCQIVILGCGIDSLALNIMKAHIHVKILEIDFEDTIEYKLKCLKKEENYLQTIWSEYSLDGNTFGNITLVGCDLRDTAALVNAFTTNTFVSTTPTLIISECVLVYLTKDTNLTLCSTLSTYFNDAVWMSYDMISPHDRFGKIMQQNITYAGYTVPGFYDFPTLESHQEKFISTQWARTKSITMLKAYRDLISMEEQKRVSKLEIFDEIEEWEMLMNHYCLTIASKGDVFADAFNDFCGIP